MENHIFYQCALCTLTNLLGKKKQIYLIICPSCKYYTLVDCEDYSNIIIIPKIQLVKNQPIKFLMPFKNIRLVLAFINNFYKIEIEYKKNIKAEIFIEDFKEIKKDSKIIQNHLEFCQCIPQKQDKQKKLQLQEVGA